MSGLGIKTCLPALKAAPGKHHGGAENRQILGQEQTWPSQPDCDLGEAGRGPLFFSWKVPALANTTNLQEKKKTKGRGLTTEPTSSNALKVKPDNLYTDAKGAAYTFDPWLQTETLPHGF